MSRGTYLKTKHHSLTSRLSDVLQKFEAGAGSGAGRNQEDTERATSHRTVHGSHRSEVGPWMPFDRRSLTNPNQQYRHCAIVDRFQLCRPDLINSRPREAQAVILRRPPPPLKLARRHPTSRSRLIYRYARCTREAGRYLCRCWGLGHAKAGDQGSRGTPAYTFRPLQADRYRPYMSGLQQAYLNS